MINLAEATTRWQRIRELMERDNLDVVIAVDSSRDEIQQGHARWLTGYIAVGGPAAAIISRDGSVELISERIGKPTAAFYQSNNISLDLVNGFSAKLLAERIAMKTPARLGVAELETFPATTYLDLAYRASPPEIVDFSGQMTALRLIKSAEEIATIRHSAAIADKVWQHMPDIFRVGRANYEIIADVEQLMRLEGAESGFNLVLPLPFHGRMMQSIGNPDRIKPNARYTMEVSPRYQGYYSQLTIPVTTYQADDEANSAYEDIVASKEAAQPLMKPGTELGDVAKFIEQFLEERGHTMSSLSLGHFCGMALEEPRHIPGQPIILEEGMTLIFHPVLAHPEYHALMRADTYLITPEGAERLNKYAGGMLHVR